MMRLSLDRSLRRRCYNRPSDQLVDELHSSDVGVTNDVAVHARTRDCSDELKHH